MRAAEVTRTRTNPRPVPWSAGQPGRTRVLVTSRPTSVRWWGGLMLRTSGIRGPGSGHCHIYGAKGMPGPWAAAWGRRSPLKEGVDQLAGQLLRHDRMPFLPRAWSSSRRELMSSLANTLCRCHSTVRAPMNSCAPISWLVRPLRASWAISSSCGVRSARVSSLRLRAVSPVARSSAARVRRRPRRPWTRAHRTRTAAGCGHRPAASPGAAIRRRPGGRGPGESPSGFCPAVRSPRGDPLRRRVYRIPGPGTAPPARAQLLALARASCDSDQPPRRHVPADRFVPRLPPAHTGPRVR